MIGIPPPLPGGFGSPPPAAGPPLHQTTVCDGCGVRLILRISSRFFDQHFFVVLVVVPYGWDAVQVHDVRNGDRLLHIHATLTGLIVFLTLLAGQRAPNLTCVRTATTVACQLKITRRTTACSPSHRLKTLSI